MLMPLTAAWPLRSAAMGAGVGGSVSQRSAAPAGSAIRTNSSASGRRIELPPRAVDHGEIIQRGANIEQRIRVRRNKSPPIALWIAGAIVASRGTPGSTGRGQSNENRSEE